jgi:GTP cyclohydrolase II
LQDEGLDTVDANLALGHEADERDYQDAVEILKDLGISKVSLLTNNPDKERALSAAGIQVKTKTIGVKPNQHNIEYLRVKAERMGHLNIEKEA